MTLQNHGGTGERNAGRSAERRRERQKELEKQRLEMMRAGFIEEGLAPPGEQTPAERFMDIFNRGQYYDAQRDDPMPSYKMADHHPMKIEAERLAQYKKESDSKILTDEEERRKLSKEIELKEKELDNYQKRADAEMAEIDARIDASKSTTKLNDLNREIKDYEFGMLKKLAPYDEEMRKLEKERVTALIVSANQKFLETDEGTVFNVNLKDQTMTKIVDGSQSEEEKKLAKAVSYIRILSEIEDSGLEIDKKFVKMLGEQVVTLLSGESLTEVLERLGKNPEDLVNRNVYDLTTGEPLSNTKENTKTAPETTVDPAPPAPPEGTTPMGETAMDKNLQRAFYQQSGTPPAAQLFNYLSDLYGRSTDALSVPGRGPNWQLKEQQP